MSPSDVVASILRFGEENTNPVTVAKYSRYFRGEYDAFGLTHDQLSGKVNEILLIPGITWNFIQEISLELVKSTKYELPVIAVKLMLQYEKSWTTGTFKTVEKWFGIGISNWAHTDYICGEMMNLFFSKKLIDLSTIGSWRSAENKFQRRAAVVCLIKPMKLSTDFTPYFEFITPVMHDPEREVHQGLGWFLRETWKKQPTTAETFLLKYKDSAPRLIFQYACEKMTPEGKAKFKRSKL